MQKLFIATSNTGKIELYRILIEHSDLSVSVLAPADLHLGCIDVIETGKTLAENAALKARAYADNVKFPILADDGGFYVEGEGFISTPKRSTLGADSEATLTEKMVMEKMIAFWRQIAKKHGGKVDAAWVDSLALLLPDGTLRTAESRREVILTDRIYGEPSPQFPTRALYISKATGKPSALQTREEELHELEPMADALRSLLVERGA